MNIKTTQEIVSDIVDIYPGHYLGDINEVKIIRIRGKLFYELKEGEE